MEKFIILIMIERKKNYLFSLHLCRHRVLDTGRCNMVIIYQVYFIFLHKKNLYRFNRMQKVFITMTFANNNLTLIKKLKVLTTLCLNDVNVQFRAFSDNSTCSLVTWWSQLFKCSVYLEFGPSHGRHLLALIPATIKTKTKRPNAQLLPKCPTNGTKPS